MTAPPLRWRVSATIWLLVRVWLGVVWLRAGWGKLLGEKASAWVGGEAGAAVTGFLNRSLERGSAPEWYADFIRETAIPNAPLFSYLVAYGEVIVGFALIVGLATNLAAVMGIVMNLAYLFAGTISKNPQMLLLESAIVFAGLAAGYYGIDRYLVPGIRNWVPRIRNWPAQAAAPEESHR
jgi:thiosulfate dehydrogenase [quinone] large subunit